MNNCRYLARAAGIAFVFLFSNMTFGAEIPIKSFSIGNVTVGVTTLADAQATYGMGEVTRLTREDEADVRICYTHVSPKRKSFLFFESGVMGGGEKITGFRISTRRQETACLSTQMDIGAMATGSGVRLGQHLEEFKKSMPRKFKRRGSMFTYEAVGQRPATAEELTRLRSTWPNEKQDYFDVTTNITAMFKNHRLVDFKINRIESY